MSKPYFTLFAYTEIDTDGLKAISINPAQGSGVWAISISSNCSFKEAAAHATLAIKHHVKHKYSSILRNEVEARLNLAISLRNMTGKDVPEETEKPLTIIKLSHDVFRSILPARHPHMLKNEDLMTEVLGRLKNPESGMGHNDLAALVQQAGIGVAPVAVEDIRMRLEDLGFDPQIGRGDLGEVAEQAFTRLMMTDAFAEVLAQIGREKGLDRQFPQEDPEKNYAISKLSP